MPCCHSPVGMVIAHVTARLLKKCRPMVIRRWDCPDVDEPVAVLAKISGSLVIIRVVRWWGPSRRMAVD